MAIRKPETKIGTCNANQILVRDKDLVEDLIGKVGFTDMIYFHILNRCFTGSIIGFTYWYGTRCNDR